MGPEFRHQFENQTKFCVVYWTPLKISIILNRTCIQHLNNGLVCYSESHIITKLKNAFEQVNDAKSRH